MVGLTHSLRTPLTATSLIVSQLQSEIGDVLEKVSISSNESDSAHNNLVQDGKCLADNMVSQMHDIQELAGDVSRSVHNLNTSVEVNCRLGQLISETRTNENVIAKQVMIN